MRKALLLSTLLAGSTLLAAPALAQDTAPPSDFTITGSAGVWSQYRFRGISQSDNKPVFQGSLTVTHKSGFYLSAWGSSATANNAVDIGGTEIDVYGGYSKTVDGWTLDGGLYGYLYPGATAGNYYEVYGDVSRTYGPMTAKLGINWAPKQDNLKPYDTEHNVYAYGELGFSLPNLPISLHSHIGHTGGAFDYVGHPYWDYTVGASYKWKMLTFDLSVVGTTVDGHDARMVDLAVDPDDHDFYRAQKTVLVGSVSASF